MGRIDLLGRRASPAFGVLCLSVSLGGCIAAAAPLMPLIGVGMAAVTGFEAYKVVQISGGGSIRVEFPGKDGKTSPPQPLPSFRRVAVWPGDEGDVMFASRLQASGRFATVVSPAVVSSILAATKTPLSLKLFTEQEQSNAFNTVCHRAKVEFVFAARPLGASTNQNMFSFSRANVTYKADLLGFSCAQHTIVWRDQIALVIEVGGSTDNTNAINQASADGWADRVIEALGGPPAKSPSAN